MWVGCDSTIRPPAGAVIGTDEKALRAGRFNCEIAGGAGVEFVDGASLPGATTRADLASRSPTRTGLNFGIRRDPT